MPWALAMGYRRSNRNGGFIEVGQITPEGPQTRTSATTDRNFWENVWNDANGLPAGLTPVTADSPELRRPVDRLYEAIGSLINVAMFTLLQDNINLMKGRIEIYNAPMAQTRFRNFVAEALDRSTADPIISVMSSMAPLREVRGVFEYLNAADVVIRLDANAAAVYAQTQIIERNVAGA